MEHYTSKGRRICLKRSDHKATREVERLLSGLDARSLSFAEVEDIKSLCVKAWHLGNTALRPLTAHRSGVPVREQIAGQCRAILALVPLAAANNRDLPVEQIVSSTVQLLKETD